MDRVRGRKLDSSDCMRNQMEKSRVSGDSVLIVDRNRHFIIAY